MEKPYTFDLKSPSLCTDSEINTYFKLMSTIGKALKTNLYERIIEAKLLGFCKYGEEIIGVASIQVPTMERKENFLKKTGATTDPNEIPYEFGMVAIKKDHRRKGISTALLKYLVEEVEDEGGIILAIAAMDFAVKNLENHGFVQKGKPYDGIIQKHLRYFERQLKGPYFTDERSPDKGKSTG